MNERFCELSVSPANAGVLTVFATRSIGVNTVVPTASLLLSDGQISQVPASGYLTVQIFDDIYTKTVIATSKMHKDVIRELFGEEGLALLTEMRMLGINAFMFSGVDPIAVQTGALISDFHTISPLPDTQNLPAKSEDQSYFIQLLTPAGPIWNVTG
jgi:hypothetical protein